MWTKLRNKFLTRLEAAGRSDRPYIVPTFDGIKLFVLNFILLIIGLVYANNYVLLFNFILFCLFLGSMYYTHFNLQGLKLISAKLAPFHVGETGILTLTFKSRSGLGHHFLGLALRNSLVTLQDKNFSFSFQANTRIEENQKSLTVNIPVVGLQRGHASLPKIMVETFFPFHLFRCFMYYSPNLSVIVYPEKKPLHIHQTKIVTEERRDEGEDFTLKDFQLGDPLKRVHWKKLAQTNRWYSKNLITPKSAPVVLSFSTPKLSPVQKENELSSIAFDLYSLHSQNIHYGLSLKDHFLISPEHSHQHLTDCLRALADYEN